MPFTAAEIARHLDGEIAGDGAVVLTGFAAACYQRGVAFVLAVRLTLQFIPFFRPIH